MARKEILALGVGDPYPCEWRGPAHDAMGRAAIPCLRESCPSCPGSSRALQPARAYQTGCQTRPAERVPDQNAKAARSAISGSTGALKEAANSPAKAQEAGAQPKTGAFDFGGVSRLREGSGHGFNPGVGKALPHLVAEI